MEVKFWLVALGAVVIKLALSDRMSFWRAASTSAAGIFSAWVFTDPVLAMLGWDPSNYRLAVAAMLALTGENLLRRLLDATASTTLLADLLKLWRGK